MPCRSGDSRPHRVSSTAVASYPAASSHHTTDAFLLASKVVFGGSNPSKPSIRQLADALDAPVTRTPQRDVEQLALTLFQHYPHRQGLLDFANWIGVKTYSTERWPELQRDLTRMGAKALVNLPQRLAYPDTPADPKALHMPAGTSDAFGHLIQKSERDGRIVMLISEQAPVHVLMHELFHVLQAKRGLPFCSPSTSTMAQANRQMERLIRNLTTRQNYPHVRWQNARQARRLVQGLQAGTLKPQPGSVGEAMRMMARRELENYRFFLTHAESVLPPAEAAELQADCRSLIPLYEAVERRSYLWG